MSKSKTEQLVGLALFTAIVAVLQLLGSFIKFGPFSISLVLIPIVVGAALYGYKAGVWLGFVFGVVVLLSGDAAPFYAINPGGAILTVLLKGILAGLCAGLVYTLLEKKNKYLAVITAAIVCPVVNTAVFLVGCFIFFLEAITEWAGTAAFGPEVLSYMIVSLVGLNFVFELISDIILSPAVLRIISIVKKEEK